ncbi:MAG: Uncharacterized protein G01um101429_941 [Parcubacteria group bacterium Gr01-1014_29]|nr:MAG: Uncharacterized protein G01um101429_941 [Parcubacteria group bacterium Gr01-1014_29]
MLSLTAKKMVAFAGFGVLFLLLTLWIGVRKPVSHFADFSLVDVYRSCVDATRSQQDKGVCLKELGDYAGQYAVVSEIDAAIASLTKPEELFWCHEFVHYAGWGLYKKTRNMSVAFREASNRCDSGMFHGIVEEYISEASDGRDPEQFITSVAPTACEQDVAENNLLPGIKGICYHGLGHAFMFITDNNLPQALRYCDMLSSTHAGGCYTGAFMENLQSKQVTRIGTHPSLYAPKPDDPDYPCNLLDEKHRDVCYRYAGISVGVRTGGDFKQAFAHCLKIDPAYQDTCFFGVGTDIPALQWSSRWAGEKCKLALEISTDAYKQCIMGAMTFLVQLNLGSPQAVNEFCGAIEPDYRDLCFESAGNNLHAWVTSDEELAEKCDKLSSVRARELCLASTIFPATGNSTSR